LAQRRYAPAALDFLASESDQRSGWPSRPAVERDPAGDGSHCRRPALFSHHQLIARSAKYGDRLLPQRSIPRHESERLFRLWKRIWLDSAVSLRSLRGPGESFNDVILRLASKNVV
jgi:hypothetical protein